MKRLFDVIFSSLGLIILSPLFVLISIVIICDSKGGIFFRGTRVGQYGKPFRIFKFRSMLSNCEGKGNWNVGDKDPRITKPGHFLRKSKLDELPQLINVFIGNMSFVGPRPELQVYVDMYTEQEKQILNLKPGITDWASITNFEQFKGFTKSKDPDTYYLKYVRPLKLNLQLYYYNHHSFYSDINCIIWTIYKIITRSESLPKNIKTLVDEYKKKFEN